MHRGRFLMGLVLVVLGLFFAARNLGWVDQQLSADIARLWPVLFVVWGVDIFLGRQNKSDLLNATILCVLGVVLLLNQFEVVSVSFAVVGQLFWPLIIILVGWSMLASKQSVGRTQFAVMSGVERKEENWPLESSSYLAFWGSIELDLAKAQIPDGETYVDLTAIMGSVEVKVPEGVAIECTGMGFLGGLEMLGNDHGGVIISGRSGQDGPEGKKIVISSRVLMGGIEIKGK